MAIRAGEVLSKIEPFAQLGLDTVSSIASALSTQTYDRGSYVFRQGEPSSGFLYLIVSGQAEITGTNEFGREIVIGHRFEHQVFGETVILTGKSYPASVRAATDLQCLLLSKKDFEGLLDHFPTFANYFMALLSDRFRELFGEVVAEQTYEAYKIDAQPINKRASELMRSPVVTCELSTPVMSIGQIMVEHNVSSVVVIDDNGAALGIITERDLVEKVITRALYNPQHELKASMVMNTEIVTVSQDAFFYQVLLEMIRTQSKHIVVLSQGKSVGVITMRDLVRTRNTGVLSIVGEIEQQQRRPQLSKAATEIDQVLRALVAEKAPIPDIFQVITELYDRLTRRVIILCVKQLQENGYGAPPAPFCWLNMGSGGRGEQTFRTDQDNAIIYAMPSGADDNCKQYYLRLASLVVDTLADCGFTRCKGQVMADNPQWCHTLTDWKEVLVEWIKHPDPINIRMLTIFLDFRPIYGQIGLADKLREHVFHVMSSFPVILRHLADDDAKTKIPLGLWGGIQTERLIDRHNLLNLKKAVCVHLVDCIRIYAYKHQILETNTLARLSALTRQGVFEDEEAGFIRTAFESLMLFRIRENLRKASLGEVIDDFICLDRLSGQEREVLRSTLKAAARLQSLTTNSFRVY